jgi:hypothetical protein
MSTVEGVVCDLDALLATDNGTILVVAARIEPYGQPVVD